MSPIIIRNFFQYLEQVRRCSPNTLKSYEVDLTQFADWLVSRFALEGKPVNAPLERPPQLNNGQPASVTCVLRLMTPEVLRMYLDQLRVSSCGDVHMPSDATWNRKLSAIRSFYKWACVSGIVTSNPACAIKVRASSKDQVRVLNTEQIAMLFSAIDRKGTDDLLAVRDSAIFALIMAAMLPISEVYTLDVGSYDSQSATLRIKARSKKDRVLNIPADVKQRLELHLEKIRAGKWYGTGEPHEQLFANKHGGRMSGRSIRRKLDKYLKEAKLPLDLTPRDLRATALAAAVEKMGLRRAFGLAGLKSKEALGRYLSVVTRN